MLLGAPWNIHMQVGHATRARYHVYRTVPLPAELRVTLENSPFEGARSQNIENNPMQSSRRPSAFEEAA
jgi:hypothetical protein